MAAEQVRSRFAASDGSEDFKPFLACLQRLGFKLQSQDASNKMFVVFVLQKASHPPPVDEAGRIAWPPLQACMYKRR